MPRIALPTALLIAAWLGAGCAAQQSFLDPGGPDPQPGELLRPAHPLRLAVHARLLVDGLHEEDGDALLQERVERVLLASGVVEPVLEHADGQIEVVLDDRGDRAAAAAKGFGSGLTFGAVGSSIEDDYEMAVTLTVGGRVFHSAGLRQPIHTLIGEAKPPGGAEMLETSAAVERVVRRLLLQALIQFQQAGAPGAPQGAAAPPA
jgi:hypothetical protein